MSHPTRLVALLLATIMLPAGVQADTELAPDVAAGKVIFEETAGGVGCASCHGMDASGDIGPDIRGRTALDILDQLAANEQMQFIQLTDDEVEKVAAYLNYLYENDGM